MGTVIGGWGIDSLTKCYLRFNGANASTVIYDDSQDHRACTPLGSSAISTTQSKFGGSSLYCPAASTGTASGVSVASVAAIGTAVFGIGMFYYPTTASQYQSIIGRGYTSAGDMLVQTDNAAVPKPLVYVSGSVVITSSISPALNTMHYFALNRDGSNLLTLYIDGASAGSATVTTNLSNTGLIFGSSSSNYPIQQGYIDNCVLTIGKNVPNAIPTRSLI